MPLFLKHRLLFIHIPKCGGDTVTHALARAGDPPFLFVADGSVMVNGHTPQHMVLSEFRRAGWSAANGFRVASLIRHPLDRVMSAFRYIHLARPDLLPLAPDPSRFLDHFLSHDDAAHRRFDNHNLGLLDFLAGDDGIVDPSIVIRPLAAMAEWLDMLGLPPIEASERRNVTAHLSGLPAFSRADIDRVMEYYARDLDWIARFAPELRCEALS